MNTGVYGADFGRAVGGVVNTVTKRGGNQIHGEAYFYNRNSSRSAMVPGASNTVYSPSTNPYVTSPYRPKDNRNQSDLRSVVRSSRTSCSGFMRSMSFAVISPARQRPTIRARSSSTPIPL